MTDPRSVFLEPPNDTFAVTPPPWNVHVSHRTIIVDTDDGSRVIAIINQTMHDQQPGDTAVIAHAGELYHMLLRMLAKISFPMTNAETSVFMDASQLVGRIKRFTVEFPPPTNQEQRVDFLERQVRDLQRQLTRYESEELGATDDEIQEVRRARATHNPPPT